MLYDILSTQFAEIQDIAASVGIDWNQHCNEPFPYKTPAKALDKASKGKVFIHADVRVCKRSGREFPYITFSNQKTGIANATYSGFYTLRALLKGQPTDTPEQAQERQKKRIERDKQIAKDKAAQEAQDALEIADARKMSVDYLDKCKPATDCAYFTKKNLSQYIPQFFSGNYYHATNGKDYSSFGAGSIVPYYDVATHEPCGFEHITNKAKLKSAKIGCAYALFEGNDPAFDKIAVVGEGVATVLSVHASLEGKFPAFAAGGVKHIKPVVKMLLSEGFEHVYILADNDDHGQSLKECSFTDLKGSYSVHMPTKTGDDFSDVYLNEGADAVCELLTKPALTPASERDVYVEHSQYCTQMPTPGEMTILKSEKGTGKTTITREFIRNFAGKTLVVSHRQLLASQIVADLADLGAVSYQDKSKNLVTAPILVASPEFIVNHMQIGQLMTYKTVFFDEIEQLFEHVTHSPTLAGKNLQSLQRLLALACNAETVIAADADAGDSSELLARIVYEETAKRAVTLQNTYKPRLERGDVFVTYDSKTALEAEFLRTVRATGKGLFISDIKRTCEELYTTLDMTQHATLLMTADTRDTHNKQIDAIEMTQDEIDQGLTKLDIYVRTFDVVLYSPCWGTGVSIKEGHGHRTAYASFCGTTNTAESCSQMLARFRGVGEYFGFIGQYTSTSAANLLEPWQIKQEMIIKPAEYTAKKQGIDLVIGRDGKVKLDDFAEFWSVTQSKKNRSRADFYNRMIEVLSKEGFEIGYLRSQVELEAQDAQAIEDYAEKKREEKAHKTQSLAGEIAGVLGIDGRQALQIATKASAYKKASYNRQFALMTRDQAHSADKAELERVSKGELSLVQLSHSKAKRKLTTAIYKLFAVEPATHEASAIMLDIENRNLLKKIDRFRAPMLSVIGKSLSDSPTKALSQLAAVVGLETSKVHNKEIYTVNVDTVKNMQLWQEYSDAISEGDTKVTKDARTIAPAKEDADF